MKVPTTAQRHALKFLLAGCWLRDGAIYTKSGAVVAKLRRATLHSMVMSGWVAVDPHDPLRYKLTEIGRARALVREHVHTFLQGLEHGHV